MHKGKEITPFPVSSLREASTRYYLLVNTLIDSEAKGWVPVSGIADSVRDLYTFVFKTRSARVKSLVHQSVSCEYIMRMMRGTLTAGEALSFLSGHYGFPQLADKLTEDISSNVFSNIAVQLFAESNPENDDKAKGGPPLGALAESLVIYFTGLDPSSYPSFNYSIIQDYPILACYGQIEEEFLRLKKRATLLDRQGGNWTLLLRAMTIPVSDKVFSERGHYQVPRAASAIGSKLKDSFQQLEMFLNF